jgi:large subunit ribosomal protein L24
MKKKFVKSWIRSRQPRKQRKYRANAPKHIRHKFLGAKLSKELREKYAKKTIPVRRGDSVRVARGQFKGKNGKVEEVDLKKSKIYIAGIEVIKKEGTKTRYAIHASNVIITGLNIDDKKRAEKLKKKEGKKEGKQKKGFENG